MDSILVQILVGISAVLFLVAVAVFWVTQSKISHIEQSSQFQTAVNELMSEYVSAKAVNWNDGRKFWSLFFSWANTKLNLDLLDTMLPANSVHKALKSLDGQSQLVLSQASGEIISRWSKLSRRARSARTFSYLFGGFCAGFVINTLLRAL